MKSTVGLTVLAVCAFSRLQAQNLAPNPSFEQNIGCPTWISQSHYATPWHSASQGTPDYLAACSSDIFAQVPSNQFGNQTARTGDAYLGFYVFYNSINAPPPVPGYREYIQAPLAQALEAGKHYSVEFYVSLSDYSRYGADAIAALFTTTPISISDDQIILNDNPQVTNPLGAPVTDKNGWTKINGCFKADSAYKYITIGCFKDGAAITYEDVGSPFLEHYSYYFIDDISVLDVAFPEVNDSVSTCLGDAVILDAKNVGTYLWSTGETTQTIQVNNGGKYWVERSLVGCSVTDTVDVAFYEGLQFSLGDDTTISFCDPIQFNVVIEQHDNATYQWSTGASTPNIGVTTPGTYSLTVTNDVGCITSDAITVNDNCPTYLYVPNAFSPNNDGFNDMFLCIAEGLSDFDLRIYNRWGQTVFRTNDFTEGWNGLHHGKRCEPGVYVYTIAYNLVRKDSFGGDTRRWKDGTLTLLR